MGRKGVQTVEGTEEKASTSPKRRELPLKKRNSSEAILSDKQFKWPPNNRDKYKEERKKEELLQTTEDVMGLVCRKPQ